MFKLKNYTTGVSYRKSIAEIEMYLSLMGATKVMKEYHGDGRVKAISFAVPVEGRELGFQLPANSEQCYKLLESQYRRRPRNKTELFERAENVSWRILKDWLYAQLSLVQIGQVKVEQIMLPYLWNGKKTLYEQIRESGFKQFQLEGPKEKD